MTNLPHCPFCLSTSLSVERLKSAWGTTDEADHVICDNCSASAPVDVWVNRAHADLSTLPTVEQVNALGKGAL